MINASSTNDVGRLECRPIRGRSRFLLAALACVLGVLASPGAAAAAVCTPEDDRGGNWSSYGRDVSNNRSQPAETKIGPGNVGTLGPVWAFTGDAGATFGQFSSTVVEHDGCVVATSINGSIYAANADTGEVLWSKVIGFGPGSFAGGLFAPAVVGDRVFVQVGMPVLPQVIAFDLATGAEIWRTVLWQHLLDGNDAIMGPENSIVPFNGMLFAMSGMFESSSLTHPSYYILDQRDGQVLKKKTVIPQEDWVTITPGTGANPVAFQAGGSIWGTPAVDSKNKYLYATTSNPKSHRRQHPYTAAILKIDVSPARPTFGEIVGSYQGDRDFPREDYMSLQCRYLGELQVLYFGLLCNQLDADIGTSPTLYRDRNGRQVIAAIQKSCNMHAAYTKTMERAWRTVNLGPFVKNGCHGSAAFYKGMLFTAGNDGVMYAIDGTTGKKRWGTKFGDEGIYPQPTTVANGVVYIGHGGELHAFDATDGTKLLTHRLTNPDGSVTCTAGVGGGVSVSNHTVYVACDLASGATGVGGAAGGNGAVFAFRLPEDGGVVVPPPAEPPSSGPATPGIPGAPIVAPPAGANVGYATANISIAQGATATFVNADPAGTHDVTALKKGPDGKALFRTPLIAAPESADVAGTETLAPGSYAFVCSVHPAMRGSIEVTGSTAGRSRRARRFRSWKPSSTKRSRRPQTGPTSSKGAR